MKRLVTTFVTLGLLAVMATAAFAESLAQVSRGSIRGTVYMDEDNDGQCTGDENEPTHPGVPIEFVNGDFSTFLQSGDDGTYGLVAASYGTWQVSARPNANDFVVTSEPTVNVSISEDDPVALNIDFCILSTEEAGKQTTAVVLPAAGGRANDTGFMIALATGLLLFGAGATYELRRRNVI